MKLKCDKYCYCCLFYSQPTPRDQSVARWEESKKWQQMVDRLKGRLREKEAEIERITKSHELAKHALERLVIVQ